MRKQKQLPDPKKAQQQYNQLKKQEETSLQIIQKLNQLYKVDRILLQHAYDTYQEKQSLEKSNQYKLIDQFYKHVFKNLFKIEKSYFQVPEEQEGSAYNYQINKNSVSKFIRDESEHFNSVFTKYSKKNKEKQLQLSGSSIKQFLKALFSTQYTAVINNGNNYLQEPVFVEQLEESIKSYYEITKETSGQKFKLTDTRFNHDQILDFLSFWIKEKQNEQFYVLYARTKEKLASQVDYLKEEAKKQALEVNENKSEVVAHPALVEIQAKNEEDAEEEKNEIQEEEKQEIMDKSQQIKSQTISPRVLPGDNILTKYRKNKIQEEDLSPNIQPKQEKKLTKKQQLQGIMKDLFIFGCKRRYPLPKSTTFEQIEQQSKTMNLEKFMNFCNYYTITACLSRELLTEMFKLYALNRLILDELRFRNIMNRMIETDKKIIDLFLKKESPQIKLREKSKLSEYKFKLRPLNGKSIETVEQQLTLIRQQKQRVKNEKMKHYLSKKLNKNKPYLHRNQTINQLPSKTNLLELNNMRDDSFDPQKFFTQDTDELLSAYESKIEEKSKGLESVLSRRLQKGDKVIKKIAKTDRNLKLYG